VKAKKMRSGRAMPDLFIAEPRGDMHGLFLELKKEGTNIYKRDGVTFVSDHIKEQHELLAKLNDKGYGASFAVGFDHSKKLIDGYLKP
jgi:hypothetical protein